MAIIIGKVNTKEQADELLERKKAQSGADGWVKEQDGQFVVFLDVPGEPGPVTEDTKEV